MSYGSTYGMSGGYSDGGRYQGGGGYLRGRGQGRGFGRGQGGRGGGFGGRGGGQGGRGRGGGFGGSKKFNSRKIFVGGVSKRDTTSESFTQFFKKFGEVEDSILMTSRDGSGGHRGFGFVTFKDQTVTDSILAQNGKLDLDGRKIDVKMALPPELNPPEGCDGKKIFVGSLPKENFNSDDLKKYFSQWGVITDSWVSQGRGFGFVTYEECNGAYKALIHGQNSGHSVREGMQLDVKWPTPKPNQEVGRVGFGGQVGYGGQVGCGEQAQVYGGYGRGGRGGYGVSQQPMVNYSSGAYTSGVPEVRFGERYQPY